MVVWRLVQVVGWEMRTLGRCGGRVSDLGCYRLLLLLSVTLSVGSFELAVLAATLVSVGVCSEVVVRLRSGPRRVLSTAARGHVGQWCC